MVVQAGGRPEEVVVKAGLTVMGENTTQTQFFSLSTQSFELYDLENIRSKFQDNLKKNRRYSKSFVENLRFEKMAKNYHKNAIICNHFFASKISILATKTGNAGYKTVYSGYIKGQRI